ncbi:hypothetical protein NQZ68_038525 [Dissostichus eleginoides]|nr:hypothetical protein NQZ68_038525 [Dissostichus eleginoides]
MKTHTESHAVRTPATGVLAQIGGLTAMAASELYTKRGWDDAKAVPAIMEALQRRCSLTVALQMLSEENMTLLLLRRTHKVTNKWSEMVFEPIDIDLNPGSATGLCLLFCG